MKKIAAFITAFILFIISATVMTISDDREIAMNNPKLGLWVNDYKDKSATAINQNLGPKMSLLLGSSEFHYGKKTKYHPSKVFANRSQQFMIIGASYTQSMFHAILVGSAAPNMQRKEAILLISPSWFKAKGVQPGAFAMRFSETEYLGFVRNSQISDELKIKVAKEVENRLSTYKDMREKVHLYNKVYVYKNASPVERLVCLGQRVWAEKADHIAFKSAVNLTKIKKYKKWVRPKHKHGQVPLGATRRWEGIRLEAEMEATERAGDNPFYMSQKLFEEKVQPRMEFKKDSSLKDSYAKSPEYEDLKIFIQVCKETGVTPKFIMLPQNGYWYDYTGFPRNRRDVARNKVKKIADEYNIEMVDLYDEGYDKYFFKDTVHPSAKGWIKINEAIDLLY